MNEKLNVYDIITAYSYGQTHCVVAENMGIAEKIFHERYPDTAIKTIQIHSSYVLVQEGDDA